MMAIVMSIMVTDMKNFVLISTVSLALLTSASVFSAEQKFDKSVAESALKQAIEKLGDIRKSIDYDQTPAITKQDEPRSNDTIKQEYPKDSSQRITVNNDTNWEYSEYDADDETFIDYVMTGSIHANKPAPEPRQAKLVWEKFDQLHKLNLPLIHAWANELAWT